MSGHIVEIELPPNRIGVLKSESASVDWIRIVDINFIFYCNGNTGETKVYRLVDGDEVCQPPKHCMSDDW